MNSPQEAVSVEPSALAVVTRGIVHLHAEYFGKGPTRARTERLGTDGVICVMRDTLTPVERTLVERGRAAQVHALRRSFQDAMEPEFRRIVEEAFLRPVAAFLSQVSLEPDVSVEVFFLSEVDGR